MSKLIRTYGDTGVTWEVAGAEVPTLPMSSWLATDLGALDTQEQFALGEAWARGVVDELHPGTYFMPYKKHVDLEEELRGPLSLPLTSEVSLKLVSSGSVADSTFRIEAQIFDPSGRALEVDWNRCDGALVESDSNAMLIGEDVRRLLARIADSPSPAATISERLEYLARAKALAAKAGAALDDYLESEDVDAGEAIGFEVLSATPDRISLGPTVTDSHGTEHDLTPSIHGKIPGVVTKREGTKRTRVVMPQSLAQDAEAIARNGQMTGADVPAFLQNPEAYLPDNVDLSDYSDRVTSIDIQIYNSRPYLHVRKSSGGWLEGAIEVQLENARDLDSAEDDESKPGLSPETLDRIANQNEEFVREGDAWIHVSDEARELSEKLRSGGFDPTQSGYQPLDGVLQVLPNLETLEFVILEEGLDLEELGRWKPLSIEPPGCLKATLRPYQLSGYQWLGTLEESDLGGLLADDMGLGKTVQILAHLGRMSEAGKLLPSLVVVPLTLMDNWEQETRKFIDRPLRIHRHEGARAQRMGGLLTTPMADIVLVSYDTLRRDQLTMAKIDWNVVVCDEAQYVKNPTAQRTSVVKALKARHRVALTGTPVENGLIEFWCIMDFVQPGKLRSWAEFREEYERPIVESTSDRHRSSLVKKLQADLQPHYLRRMKDEVAKDLPPKHDPVSARIALSREQHAEYSQVIHDAKSGGRGAALGAIQVLLQVSARPPIHLLSAPVDQRLEACPKLAYLVEVLERIRDAGEKVVVFTRFLELQKLIQQTVQEKFGIHPDCINGSIPFGRQKIVDLFGEKEGFNVLVLSHDAAGVGLNVTAANHVVHYTRPWNPAKENQATDRVYRIGQTRDVHVYTPVVCRDDFVTVEDRLAMLLQDKSELARDVLVPHKDWAVTKSDLLDCVTQEIPPIQSGSIDLQ